MHIYKVSSHRLKGGLDKKKCKYGKTFSSIQQPGVKTLVKKKKKNKTRHKQLTNENKEFLKSIGFTLKT